MTTWEVIGAIGQVCFFSRVMVQWLVSEKERRSANPGLFWWLSLGASVLLSVATVGLEEWILLPGYFVNGAVYVRNLTLGSERVASKAREAQRSRLGPVPAAIVGLALSALLIAWGLFHSDSERHIATGWIVAGVTGQAIWSTRFILQWWLSERAGFSHFPLSFWWLSLFGSMLNLAYTLQLETPIFWIGFVTAWFVPLRNLMLEYRHRRSLA